MLQFLLKMRSAPVIVWRLGRIGNPVRIRDGTAAVCVEVPGVTKVGHWEYS